MLMNINIIISLTSSLLKTTLCKVARYARMHDTVLPYNPTLCDNNPLLSDNNDGLFLVEKFLKKVVLIFGSFRKKY